MKKISLIAAFWTILFCPVAGQTFGTFTSVQPGTQDDTLHLPATHTFQMLIQTGDALTGGGNLPGNNDFTGYVPIGGSSSNGYISLNHENTPGAVTILDVNFTFLNHLWNISASNAVNTAPYTMTRNCSGGLTSWGTVLSGEESTNSGDSSPPDGYEDVGWLCEINPVTRTLVQKCWAIGRCEHENAVVASDNVTLYTGADNSTQGFVYKFVADSPMDMSSGTLYVLTKPSLLSATGTWVQVPNSTQAQRNTTGSLAAGLGARNFNGVEDVEIGILDNKVYFAAKSSGRVYRFTDNRTVGTGTDITDFEVFVGGSVSYNIDYGSGSQNEAWGTGNDNLTFDGEGNLYVLQDGGRNHIWMVRPGHTQASPQVELFMRTPAGSEPTGMTFSPNFNFCFVSIQHPSASNSDTQIDATGGTARFNRSSTLVIARREYLGPTANFPVEFVGISAERRGPRSGVDVDWETASESGTQFFAVERSVDGTAFQDVGQVAGAGTSGTLRSYQYYDAGAPSGKLYYRIRQVDTNGQHTYSDVVTVSDFEQQFSLLGLYPNPSPGEINVQLGIQEAGSVRIQVINLLGSVVLDQRFLVPAGSSGLQLPLEGIAAGKYLLVGSYGSEKQTLSFDKVR